MRGENAVPRSVPTRVEAEARTSWSQHCCSDLSWERWAEVQVAPATSTPPRVDGCSRQGRWPRDSCHLLSHREASQRPAGMRTFPVRGISHAVRSRRARCTRAGLQPRAYRGACPGGASHLRERLPDDQHWRYLPLGGQDPRYAAWRSRPGAADDGRGHHRLDAPSRQLARPGARQQPAPARSGAAVLRAGRGGAAGRPGPGRATSTWRSPTRMTPPSRG